MKAERMAGPCAQIADPVSAVRLAKMDPRDIEEMKESRAQESLSEEEEDESDQEEDFEDFYRRETAKYRSAHAKREFFTGMRLQLRVDSVQLILNSLRR